MLKCPALGYAHAKLCILSNPDCLVEQPDIFNNLPSHNDTGRNNRPIKQKICRQRIALIRAIVAAADKDRDEMTVLLIHGEPAAVIAPYGHERRPGAAVGIGFDQTAPPEARLVLTDVWGGSIRMSTREFRQLARDAVASRFEAMAQIAEAWT